MVPSQTKGANKGMFSKESARHLYDLGEHVWCDLFCLGGHSDISPVPLGGLSEIRAHPWVPYVQWSDPPRP